MDQNTERKFRWSDISVFIQMILMAIGTIFLVIASIKFYCYLTFIYGDITEGSGYGFTIGQTKQEVYKIAQSKFKKGKIVEIEADLGRSKKYWSKNLEHNKKHKVSDVETWFHQWDCWQLELEEDDPNLFRTIIFKGNHVSFISLFKVEYPTYPEVKPLEVEFLNEWIPTKMENPSKIVVGQTYEEAYQTLLDISREPSYEKLVIKTASHCRRVITNFTMDEYLFIGPYEDWRLYYETGLSKSKNTLFLKFADGKLIRILRQRDYCAL